MRPVLIAGARPNFMKIAPILRELDRAGDRSYLIHTGQHYDEAMSDNLFRDLGLRTPDVNFAIGSASHAVQTARVMECFDAWLDAHPDVDTVVVVGDVNSTVGTTLVASKRGLPVAHVEAGLRSKDRAMPEEVNRIVTDALASWLLTPSPDGEANLIAEGVSPMRITAVGNVMVDSLFDALTRLPDDTAITRLGLAPKQYGLVTLHRPALVDDPTRFEPVVALLAELSERVPLVFPVHPRTRSRLESLHLPSTIKLLEPLGYLEFVAAQCNARVVLTDSGGVQEETTCLGVPCLTLRENTERPITVTEGTNVLVGMDPDTVRAAFSNAICARMVPRRPALWDGAAAQRIVAALRVRPEPGWFK